jgi:hypothetical protein
LALVVLKEVLAQILCLAQLLQLVAGMVVVRVVIVLVALAAVVVGQQQLCKQGAQGFQGKVMLGVLDLAAAMVHVLAAAVRVRLEVVP